MYIKKYEYKKILKILLLQKEYYNNLHKIFKFYDKAIEKGRILLKENKSQRIIILILKKILDFEEVECNLELKEKKKDNIELLIKRLEEIKQIAAINNEKIATLLQKNDENDKNQKILKNKINKQKSEIKKKKKKIIELQKNIQILKIYLKKKNKNKIITKEEKDINLDINLYENFKKNPNDLIKKETLINYYNNKIPINANLCFDVFTGLKDNKEYMVYSNLNNYNIEIMLIPDKNIVQILKGHKYIIKNIKYYKKNNKEDYILSFDLKNKIYLWDIQNNYNKINDNNFIRNKIFIFDILLLFNIVNNNYIIISNINQKYHSILFELKEHEKNNLNFIRKIYGTKTNRTMFMIPWIYNNKYYIIDFCQNEIIKINNLFKDECYYEFSTKESINDYGYIYNQNYLCATDINHNYITIFDLKQKCIHKRIVFDKALKYGSKMVTWNNKYTIIGCFNYLVILDIEEEKIINKIEVGNYNSFKNIKKIKIGNEESLIISDTCFIIKYN